MRSSVPARFRFVLPSMSPLGTREVTTAKGKKIACPYFGPVKVKIPNCDCFTGVLVLGDSVLLGRFRSGTWISLSIWRPESSRLIRESEYPIGAAEVKIHPYRASQSDAYSSARDASTFDLVHKKRLARQSCWRAIGLYKF
jgi:hypothetical protein